MTDGTLRDRLTNAKGIIRSLEDELRAADHGLMALNEELEERARKLQQSESRFRSLIENIAEGITVASAEGALQFVSAGIEQIAGFTPAERLGGSIFEGVHPDDLPAVRTGWAELLTQPGGTASMEIRVRHSGGDWRTVEVTAKNLLDDPGVAGVVVTYRDITAQRAVEEQFRQAQKMEAVGRLAGGVAHDFNNLLTAVKGYAQLALEELSAPDQLLIYLEEIARAAERAASLTGQLLAFSRQQVTQPRVMDLGEAIRDAEKMLTRLIGEDVQVELAIAPDLGRVLADPTQIEQVLMNLAVNARDAMPRGGHFRLEAGNATLDREFAAGFPYPVRPGDYVRIAVSDTGEGMDEAIMKQVFEPFFTTKPRGKGTGLGLSTVYGITKQAGGYIWVQSEPGRGTTFEVYLPRTQIEPPREPAAVAPISDVSGSETVLVVEDQPIVRTLARRSLERVGYRVLEAESGADAIRLCVGERGVDLLLTDVVMPHMGGRELAARVQQECGSVRVLYMSGYDQEQITSRGLLGAGINLIQKPFGPHDLQRRVREVLDSA